MNIALIEVGQNWLTVRLFNEGANVSQVWIWKAVIFFKEVLLAYIEFVLDWFWIRSDLHKELLHKRPPSRKVTFSLFFFLFLPRITNLSNRKQKSFLSYLDFTQVILLQVPQSLRDLSWKSHHVFEVGVVCQGHI